MHVASVPSFNVNSNASINCGKLLISNLSWKEKLSAPLVPHIHQSKVVGGVGVCMPSVGESKGHAAWDSALEQNCSQKHSMCCDAGRDHSQIEMIGLQAPGNLVWLFPR